MSKINITIDQDKKALKEAYNQALADLTTIQNTDLNTNAKLQQAVKGIADIVEKLLKVVKRRI
ncbi:unnamed protein product [marine sediment metagenome]|uniref:Uncharacterized protein n=1 Tax=marine sediment metagenome TaxID=412755 RepID=X1BNB9_9ZZZZ